jgi:hypothetical protein
MQYLCNLPEIHAHAKVKDKIGYGKRYHCLVVVQLSILYMENVLRAKFSRQCDNCANGSDWVNITALCKLADSRVRTKRYFEQTMRIFSTILVSLSEIIRSQSPRSYTVLGNILKFVMDIPLLDNIFSACFWTSCVGIVSVTVIMASLSVMSARIMDLVLFSLSK